ASPEFMVFHPAWGYFANAYGLKQIPIEVEGKEPKAADLKRLIEYAQAQKVKTIFVQPQYSDAIARTIAASIGATVVPADPLAPDWAANLLQMGEKFKAALK
ncbi:MAG: zinc ABC transporter solute-binding protein, partial [Deltaproteobacteria bacterium]|nr:zinc ABC transporter solute-binding protein [Deltaproteobacteria bacterium]